MDCFVQWSHLGSLPPLVISVLHIYRKYIRQDSPRWCWLIDQYEEFLKHLSIASVSLCFLSVCCIAFLKYNLHPSGCSMSLQKVKRVLHFNYYFQYFCYLKTKKESWKYINTAKHGSDLKFLCYKPIIFS